MTSSPTFLGFDLSTQSLKAILLGPNLALLHQETVTFDKDLPHYATTGGAIQGPVHGQVTSPVAMWLEAFDLIMDRMNEKHVQLASVVAVSGAGQQHGSVYWSAAGIHQLSRLDPAKSLRDQLVPHAFTLPNAPIWQDSSTTAECHALQEALGGEQRLADLSGSRAYERFTGPQIAKIRRTQPDVYAQTSHISLVSSFCASLFLGALAPIEIADASGMNLLNVLTLKWDPALLDACAGGDGSSLRIKLGPSEPVPGGSNLGPVSNWWVKRWGFNEECIVAPWTGDNPASVAGLSSPGDAILSLGTSTTFLLAIPPSPTGEPPRRLTTSHLLTHPSQTDPPGYIAMLCYKNGALARERVRDEHCGGSWDTFNVHLERGTTSGNDGWMGFYFPLLEIIPPNVQGEFLFRDGKPLAETHTTFPATYHARAILESQFLSIKRRIQLILPSSSPSTSSLKRLIITGGSSANPAIRQLAADVFNMPVHVARTKESAGVGGALLAQWAWCRSSRAGADAGAEGGLSFEAMKEREGEKEMFSLVASPRVENMKVYEKMLPVYAACEEWVVKNYK